MDFKTELLTKVKALGAAHRRDPRRQPRAEVPLREAPGRCCRAWPRPPVLRTHAAEPPDIIAIGSSTGGPQALFSVLGVMRAGTVRQPILITQHMPATFTTILASTSPASPAGKRRKARTAK